MFEAKINPFHLSINQTINSNTTPQQKHKAITCILAIPYILLTRYGFETAITHKQNIKTFIIGRTSPNLLKNIPPRAITSLCNVG